MGDVQPGEDTLPGHRGRGEVLRDAGEGIQVQPYLGKCTETGRNSCYLCLQRGDKIFRYIFLNKVVFYSPSLEKRSLS